MNRPEPSPRPFFSVYSGDHRDCAEICNLIRSDEARSQCRREIFALRRTQPASHLLKLDIARTEVVHDGIAGNVILRLSFRDVPALSSNDTGQFQLIVQLRRLQRPGEVLVWTNNGAMVPF